MKTKVYESRDARGEMKETATFQWWNDAMTFASIHSRNWPTARIEVRAVNGPRCLIRDGKVSAL